MSKKHAKGSFNTSSAPTGMALSRLKPTQMTVGMREVEKKRVRFRKMMQTPGALEKNLQANPVLVVLGPEDSVYVVDRHHMALALTKEGFEKAPVKVMHDFSDLTPKQFWKKMLNQKLVYPYDANGVERPLTDLPQKLTDMEDDIYRSLAWFVRQKGGFNKVETPYAEFKWARYFQQYITPAEIEKSFDNACAKALTLAHDPEAGALPGYTPAPAQKAAPAKTAAFN